MTAQKRSRRLFKLLLMVFLSIIQLYPLLWMLSSSFKPNAEIFQNLSLIPQTFTLENYSKGWGGVSGIGFGAYLWNTFFLSVLCIAGNLFSCSLAAYALSLIHISSTCPTSCASTNSSSCFSSSCRMNVSYRDSGTLTNLPFSTARRNAFSR